MSFLITRALLEDLPAMIELETSIFGQDAWSPELMVAEVSFPESYYLVAKLEGGNRLAGYAGLRAALQSADQGDIQTIAVAEDFRRQGLARKLLQELMEQARVRGVGELFLEVRADNEAARQLYVSEGFEDIDRRSGYYQPDGVDAIVMKKRLEASAPGWAER